MRRFMICTIARYDDEGKSSIACSKYGREHKSIQSFGEKPYVGPLARCIHKKDNIKVNFKQNGRVWSGFLWFRIQTIGQHV